MLSSRHCLLPCSHRRTLVVPCHAAKGFGTKPPPPKQPKTPKQQQQQPPPSKPQQPSTENSHVQLTAEDVASITPVKELDAAGYAPLAEGACPCGSSQLYEACCAPYHRGASAPTPEATARARFSAFVKGEEAYAAATTHKDYLSYHYEGQTISQASESLLKDIGSGCTRFDYHGFVVTQVEAGSNPDEGFVAFAYKSSVRDASVPLDQRAWKTTQEKGRFLRVNGVWQFVDYQRFEYDPNAMFAAPAEPVAAA